MPGQSHSAPCSPDIASYQGFWSTLPLESFKRWAGKSVAVQFTEGRWQIVEAADGVEQLRDALLASGVDLESVVIDRIPTADELEEHSIGGVQLL